MGKHISRKNMISVLMDSLKKILQLAILINLCSTVISLKCVIAETDIQELWSKGIAGTTLGIEKIDEKSFAVTGRIEDHALARDRVIFLSKYDIDGNQIWTRHYSCFNLWDSGWSVKKTSDEGFIIGGTTFKHYFKTIGSNNLVLLKTDNMGNLEWFQTYGGNGSDVGREVIVCKDGSYAITGNIGITPCLIKTDSIGNQLWIKTYRGSEGISLRQTDDSGFILLTSTFLIKTDSNGEEVWYTNIGCKGKSVIISDDNNFIIGGVTDGSLCLVKVDVLGNILWKVMYASRIDSELGGNVIPTSDGGYIIVGEYYHVSEGGDYYIIKTDNEGNLVYEFKRKAVSYRRGASIIEAENEEYIIAGTTQIVKFVKSSSLKVHSAEHAARSVVTGGGTYLPRSLVSFSVLQPVVLGELGIRYSFRNWTSWSPNGYNGTSISPEIILYNDIEEYAFWDKEYYLDINSDIPVNGGGWYLDGEQVTLSMEPQIFGFRVFSSWSGDINYFSNEISVTMDGPKEISVISIYNHPKIITVFIIITGVIFILRKRLVNLAHEINNLFYRSRNQKNP